MNETEPTFVTERLRVWEIIGNPSPENGTLPRHMYIATISEYDWPGVAVSLSVWTDFDNYIDWIETAEVERRKGYATELIRAVESRLGQLALSGVTQAGIGLEGSLDQESPS